MPKRNSFLTLLVRCGALVDAVVRLYRREPEDAWEYGTMAEPATEPVPAPHPRPRPHPGGRLALVSTLTMLFFAGGSFTAVAGDQAATMLEGYESTAVELSESQAAESAVTPDAEAPAAAQPATQTEVVPEVVAQVGNSVEAAPAPEVQAESMADPALAHTLPSGSASASSDPEAALGTAPDPTSTAPVTLDGEAAAGTPASTAPQPVLSSRGPSTTRAASKEPHRRVAQRTKTPPIRQPEIERKTDAGAATVWLNRTLPDPTPAAKRLEPRFAKRLIEAARRHDADWAAILGVLRAQGSRGSTPATPIELERLAALLAGKAGKDTWRAALALSARTDFADRVDALADYYRAVGVRSLVVGFKAAKERLVKRLLADERVWLYWGGRSDLEADRIDVRIIVLVRYLAERHGSVTVSSLFSGHRKFARPGVISAHTYGQAIDIAAVGGTSVLGNSRPGGMTEEAVRSILLLPAELQPQQVISLLGLGGPSFPLADHGDHIHVGY